MKNNQPLDNDLSNNQKTTNNQENNEAEAVTILEDAMNNQLQQKVEELESKLKYALAEGENIRRQKDKQIDETRKYAVSKFAGDMINAAENLHRAIDAIPKDKIEEDQLLKAIFEGVEMTRKEIASMFERYGIVRIMPQIGEMFNHDLHQAVLQIPTNDHPENAIVQVLQAGYSLHDRLLRPAIVGVAKAIA